ncbi:hypothetical protein RF55_23240, partial [Lasius niger]
MGWEEDWL